MAEIFDHPKEMKIPSLADTDFDNYEKECEKFKSDLKDFLLKRNPKGKNVGEIVGFPMGDGYAQYMIASMKPMQLVHLKLGDAWDYPYVHKMNAKDIQTLLDRDKAMAKLFSKKD